MDASIRAATVLNSWTKIEHLIDQELIIASFHQKNKRAASAEKVTVLSDTETIDAEDASLATLSN
jgi:hypothetical protein